MDLKMELGADDAASIERFAIYMPDRDKDSAPVLDFDEWVENALLLMAEINGGVTKLPAALGLWNSDVGHTVRENTNVVYSFIRQPEVFKKNIGRIATFIHSFGKYTNQGEVMVEFSGFKGTQPTLRSYYISKYKKAASLDGR